MNKKSIAGFVGLVAALAFATSAYAAVFTATLTIGSTGAEVTALQVVLNSSVDTQVSASGVGSAGNETAYFGTMTQAAVIKFQIKNGVSGTGVVGPLTRAVLNAGSSVTTTSAAFTAGCTSAAGYSSTTGKACAAVAATTLPAGCTSATGFSPTTGKACVAVAATTLPAGCTSATGFSTTTGSKCDSTATAPVTDGALTGGVGTIEDADFISSLNNEEVGEGADDVQVVGYTIEADNGSDIKITSAKVLFEEMGGVGSDDLDDYATEVSVWFDGKKVGSVDVDDMSENSGVWSSSIALSGAIIRAGEEEKLIIAVTAANSIDSGDLGTVNNDWEVQVESVRFTDADGAISTEGDFDFGTDRDFFFDTFASAEGVELTINDEGTPSETSTEVDEDGGSEVTLLIGELEADGSDILVTELSVEITPDGASSEEIASRYILIIDGDEVASVDADECDDVDNECSDDDNDVATYVFGDFEVTVKDGKTLVFSVVAELNEIDGGDFIQGDSLTARVDADALEAEAGSDDLTTDELSGIAQGEEQSFYEEGHSAVLVEDSSSASASGNVGTFVFVLDITAFGESDVDLDVGDFDIDVYSDGIDTSTSVSGVLSNHQSNITKVGGTYTWNDETGKITLTVYISTTGVTEVGVYTVTLEEVGGQVVDEELSTYISFS